MTSFAFGGMQKALGACAVASRRPDHPRVCLTSGVRRPSESSFLQKSSIGELAGQSLGILPQNEATVCMMRHRRKVAHLDRPADQRKALLRSLTTEILRHGAIKTTETKAKAVRKYVDKMIQLAKRGDLHARRQVLAFVYDKDVVGRLFDQANERYGERDGGYCRIRREAYSKRLERVVPLRARRGDNAKIVAIELV